VDKLQGLPIRGNLSTIWAAKGFKALYQVTRDMAHLKAGEKCADYASLSQASWDPHYIYTANPFGGCTVDNVDTATWMDARQCDLVEPFIWYGLELGRRDLVERAEAVDVGRVELRLALLEERLELDDALGETLRGLDGGADRDGAGAVLGLDHGKRTGVGHGQNSTRSVRSATKPTSRSTRLERARSSLVTMLE